MKLVLDSHNVQQLFPQPGENLKEKLEIEDFLELLLQRSKIQVEPTKSESFFFHCIIFWFVHYAYSRVIACMTLKLMAAGWSKNDTIVGGGDLVKSVCYSLSIKYETSSFDLFNYLNYLPVRVFSPPKPSPISRVVGNVLFAYSRNIAPRNHKVPQISKFAPLATMFPVTSNHIDHSKNVPDFRPFAQSLFEAQSHMDKCVGDCYLSFARIWHNVSILSSIR